MAQFEYNADAFKEKKLIIKIQGKDYLTVQGRLRLAHDSGQMHGVDVEMLNTDDTDWITTRSTVKIYNPHMVAELSKIAKECGPEVAAHIAPTLLFSQYQGLAKSPAEWSEMWKLLGNVPEKARPLEKCSTDSTGRALGCAGFGEGESFATGDEVESAIARSETFKDNPNAWAEGMPTSGVTPPSEKQMKFVVRLLREKRGLRSESAADRWAQDTYGKGMSEFSAKEISTIIDTLMAESAPEPKPGF